MGDLFQFSSSASLGKLTGRSAHNLEELLQLIKTCPDSSIFFHTFLTFKKMREVQVPFNNDFAFWISQNLADQALPEKLTAIELAEHSTIESLRDRIVAIIENHKKEDPQVFNRTAAKPFYLCDAVRIVYLTDKFAYNLKSFRESLDSISVDSIYFHFIESRLQTQLQTDDFSRWIQESLDMPELAAKIRNIDIHIHTLEGLRHKLTALIDQYL